MHRMAVQAEVEAKARVGQMWSMEAARAVARVVATATAAAAPAAAKVLKAAITHLPVLWLCAVVLVLVLHLLLSHSAESLKHKCLLS